MNYELEIQIKSLSLLEWLGKENPALALMVHDQVKEIILLAKSLGKEEAIKEMSDRVYAPFPNPNTYPDPKKEQMEHEEEVLASMPAEQMHEAHAAMMLNDGVNLMLNNNHK